MRPTDEATTDFDSVDFFKGRELIGDPYPYFDHLRDQCPVQAEPHHGVVMVTGYDGPAAIYTAVARFSSCVSGTAPSPGLKVPVEGDDIPDVTEPPRDELPFSDHPPTRDPPAHK